MIFKIFISYLAIRGKEKCHFDECRVLHVENGHNLEQRIDIILSNFKSDGCEEVHLRDCINISEPCRNPER